MLTFEDAASLLHNESSSVDTHAETNINREILPILMKLLTQEPENYDHPSAKQLLNWLVDSKRTVEEFRYFVGPLQRRLVESLEKTKEGVINILADKAAYLSKIGLEALAIVCPVLEGPWEQAAWFLTVESCGYSKEMYGASSDHLSSWIILMIGNSDLCPNHYLRIRFMSLLFLMVDLGDHNQTQAVESVLSVFSFLNNNYREIDLDILNYTFENLENVGYLKNFDEALDRKLHDIEISRVNTTVHDIAHNSALFPNRYTLPIAYYNLTALLKTISEIIKQVERDNGGDMEEKLDNVDLVISILCIVVSNLTKSCSSPLLLDQTVSCTNTVMGVVTSPSINSHITQVQEKISKLLQLLRTILPTDTFKTMFEGFIEYIFEDLASMWDQ